MTPLPDRPDHVLSRRAFVLRSAGVVGSLPLLLAACGEDDEAASGSAGGGSFSYTDDRGERIALPELPQRIVAHEYAAVALWDYGVRPVGIYASTKLSAQPLLEGMDLEGVKSVGEVWGEVNLEALAALRPDLIITTWWPGHKLLGGIKDDKLERKMAAIAPIAGVHAQVPATRTIEHFTKLAGALGKDEDAKPVADAKARFEKAIATFKAAAKKKPGLKVMALYADPEKVYVGKTPDYSDLREYAQWGMNIVDAGGKEPYWEIVSWENMDKFPADLILWDARATSPRPDKLDEIPAWKQLPAVKAGQISPWHMEEAVSYRVYAGHIEELAAAIERSEVIT